MSSGPMIEPLPSGCLGGRSHLESGYVASQTAGSVLAPSCRHLASGHGSPARGVRAKGAASPSWNRATKFKVSILLAGAWPKCMSSEGEVPAWLRTAGLDRGHDLGHPRPSAPAPEPRSSTRGPGAQAPASHPARGVPLEVAPLRLGVRGARTAPRTPPGAAGRPAQPVGRLRTWPGPSSFAVPRGPGASGFQPGLGPAARFARRPQGRALLRSRASRQRASTGLTRSVSVGWGVWVGWLHLASPEESPSVGAGTELRAEGTEA